MGPKLDHWFSAIVIEDGPFPDETGRHLLPDPLSPFHKQLVLTIKFIKHNQEQHNCDHPACVEKKGSY